MIKKYFNRFPHTVRGLKHALINDFGFRTQIYLGVLVAFIACALLLPLSTEELLFIVFSYALVLITELQNSALEEALDKIHPEKNQSIGHSKDMASAAVLIAGLLLLLTMALILCDRMFI